MSNIDFSRKLRRKEIGAATTVTSFVLTGAFILQGLNIPPLLTLLLQLIMGSTKYPSYFGLALGATGAFSVVYYALYVTVLFPLRVYAGFGKIEDRVRLNHIDPSDFIITFFIVLVYVLALYIKHVRVDMISIIGGFVVILTSIIFRAIPKWVSQYMKNDAFFPLKVTVFSIALSFVLFIPSLYIVSLITQYYGQ